MNRANPNKDFKMNAICKICNHEFEVTLNKNMKTQLGATYAGFNSEYKTLNWLTGATLVKSKKEEINIHLMVCPNCGFEDALFYVSTGKILEDSEITRPW